MKFRSAKTARSTSGSFAVSSRITKAASATTATDRHRGDRRRVEPVRALAPVQHELQAPEPEHHEEESRDVHAPRRLRVRGVEQERARHEEAEHADGQVDVEDPAPGPVVGDPSPHRRPERRGEHDPESPHRHGHAALVGRKDLPQHRLRDGDDRPAPQTLEDAHGDQELDGGRDGGEKGADGEQRGADQEKAPPSEPRGEPPGGGQRDGIGREVRGEHPRDLVEPRGERPLDVGQGDVGDAGVEDLEHRHQHDGDGDGPAPSIAERELARGLSARRHCRREPAVRGTGRTGSFRRRRESGDRRRSAAAGPAW